MKQQREIVRGLLAMLLVAIYSIATVSSSAAILLCEHPHHHHTEAHHDHDCECGGIAFVADCCDHHHTLLGENHTDYIANELRHDSRSAHLFALLLQPHVAELSIESLQAPTSIIAELSFGDEHEPLRAALLTHESLRAPPVFA
jgi:hypothetical protein